MTLDLPIDLTWDGAPAEPGERALVRLRPEDEALRVEVEAPFHGDPPPEGQPGPTWALWEHEVVELFILGPDQRYLELELGPHGHHLLLLLHGRRTITERLLPLQLEVAVIGDRWTARAWLPWALLPPGPHHVNATAIHGQGEGRRYLSHVALGGEQPDFHRLEAFVPVPASDG